jgi:hypothetical protein
VQLYRYFVSFAAITLCVASQQVFIVVYFIIDSVWKLLDTPLYVAYHTQQTCRFFNDVLSTAEATKHQIICEDDYE